MHRNKIINKCKIVVYHKYLGGRGRLEIFCLLHGDWVPWMWGAETFTAQGSCAIGGGGAPKFWRGWDPVRSHEGAKLWHSIKILRIFEIAWLMTSLQKPQNEKLRTEAGSKLFDLRQYSVHLTKKHFVGVVLDFVFNQNKLFLSWIQYSALLYWKIYNSFCISGLNAIKGFQIRHLLHTNWAHLDNVTSCPPNAPLISSYMKGYFTEDLSTYICLWQCCFIKRQIITIIYHWVPHGGSTGIFR